MHRPKLQLERVDGAELVHHVSDKGRITSHANTVRCTHRDGTVQTFRFDQAGWKKAALPFRLARRLFRLDKLVVVPVEDRDRWTALTVVRDGRCYHVDLESERITPTLTLRQSRNPLHQSICRTDHGWFYQGEYGSNPDRCTVPVYRSKDGGKSWHVVYEFPAGKARHIHGCFWDPIERRVWVCTGDFAGENHLLVADEDFNDLEWLGDGSQTWRTCHLLFTEQAVFWGMDSQLEQNYICRLDRSTRHMQRVTDLPGPIWYAKALSDGWFIAASVVEHGEGVLDQHARIFASRDGEAWHEVYRVRKDRWKMPHFKNGVINFADGPQNSNEFYLSAEALSGIDGRVLRASLVPNDQAGDPTLRKAWVSMTQWLNDGSGGACPFRFPDTAALVSELGLPDVEAPLEPAAEDEFPDVQPALKRVDERVLRSLQTAMRENPTDARLHAWSEKLLRVVELRLFELASRCRHDGETREDARFRVLWLCLFFLEFAQSFRDPRYTNVVLKVLDQSWLAASPATRPGTLSPWSWRKTLVVLVHGLLRRQLDAIERGDWKPELSVDVSGTQAARLDLPMQPVFGDSSSPGVVVFSPSPYSLYTLTVLHLLQVHGVDVRGIVVRRLFNRQRFVQEFRRDGSRLLRKIWGKLVLRQRAYSPRRYQTLPEYMTQIGVTHRDMRSWAQDHGTPLIKCTTLNDDHVVEALQELQPSAVVFTGGGLIREPVLQAAGAGVINTHMGILPPYRGMDVVEWPILAGHAEQVGVTVHFMDKGVDEGDILSVHYADQTFAEDIRQLRERIEVLMPQAGVAATLQFLQGQLQPQPQSVADGKQYFVMHPRLQAIASDAFRARQACGDAAVVPVQSDDSVAA